MTSIDAAVSAVCDRISKPLARTRRQRGYREGDAGSMAGRRKGGARRRTCVISAICQSKPHSSELARRNALAGLRPHRQANSSAKRWITFARASTARDRRNRRSRSGCRRRAKRASIFPRRRRGRHPNALVAQRNEPCAKGAAAARRRLHRVRAPRVTRSSERVTRLPRRRRSRDRRAAARASVRRRLDVHRPGRRRGRRDPPFVVRPPSVPRPRVDAGRKPDKAGRKRPVRVRHRTCFQVSRAWQQARVLRGDRLSAKEEADGLK